MHLRAFLQSIFLLPVVSLLGAPGQAQSIAPRMKKVAIDGWLLELPEDWRVDQSSKPNEPIFRPLDRKSACFVRVQALPQTIGMSPVQLALEVRQSFQQSAEQTRFKWRVMRETVASTAIGVVQNLDLFDAENKVRYVLKTVITGRSMAMLILHDYSCESHSASDMFFAPILESLSPSS